MRYRNILSSSYWDYCWINLFPWTIIKMNYFQLEQLFELIVIWSTYIGMIWETISIIFRTFRANFFLMKNSIKIYMLNYRTAFTLCQCNSHFSSEVTKNYYNTYLLFSALKEIKPALLWEYGVINCAGLFCLTDCILPRYQFSKC